MTASMIEKNRENSSDFRTTALRQGQTTKPYLFFCRSYFRKTHTAPMWDDPSVQVRFVRFLCGIASPGIVLSQFALNKVIAHFSNSHREMASLKDIRIDFSY